MGFFSKIKEIINIFTGHSKEKSSPTKITYNYKKESETISPRRFTEEEMLEHRLQCLKEAAQARSDADYQKHMSNINAFDALNPIATDNNPLTAIEKAFLKYLEGRKVSAPDIAGYWSYEYSINFNYTVSKYINNKYLCVGGATPEKLTVEVLKDILEYAGLPKTGKKAVLVERVKSIPENKLPARYQTEKYYRLTETGQALVDAVQDSATKDTDFEDAVLSLLYAQKIIEAAKMVHEYRSSRQPYGGELSLYDAPSERQIQLLKNYYNILPFKEAACIIFSHLMGFSATNEKKLFKRILDTSKVDKTAIYTMDNTTEIANHDPEEEYQIICSLDDSTCPTCGKMDLRHFQYGKAKIGKNYPPFHEGCRCVVVPYFDDFADDERVARGKNGKAIYVPGNMKWAKWKEKYGN